MSSKPGAGQFDWNEARWIWWQRVVIIGGVVATLAGAASLPTDWITWIHEPQSLAWLRGIPAAIVTIAAGYLSSFTYRDDAVRHELTAMALWNELVKYQARAEPYNRKTEQEDTSAFLNVICKIVEMESHNWSALVLGTPKEDQEENEREGDTPPANKPRATPAQST